jgi:hypothetical protein
MQGVHGLDHPGDFHLEGEGNQWSLFENLPECGPHSDPGKICEETE